MKFFTSDVQINDLQHAVNEARENSTTVRVDRAALRALLLDHHSLVDRLVRNSGESNDHQ